MIKKFIKKQGIGKILFLLSTMACVFTICIGTLGIISASNMNENTEYIYSYREYTDLVYDIKENMSLIEINEEKAKIDYKDEYKNEIEKSNEKILKNIDIYNSTEYEDEEEKNYIDNIETAYKEFYSILSEVMDDYKEQKNVKKEKLDEKDVLKNTIYENITNVKEYLDYWAEEDKNSTDREYYVFKWRYGIIVFLCVGIFIAFSISVLRSLTVEVTDIRLAMKEVSQGNFCVELPSKNNNEFDEIKSYINDIVDNFNVVIGGLKRDSSIIEQKTESVTSIFEEITSSIENIYVATENITKGAEQQVINTDETMLSLENLSDNIVEVSNNICVLNDNAYEITNKTNDGTVKMDEIFEEFIEVINVVKSFSMELEGLGTSINEITEITDFINDISEQTNLLALNAAIESARVGEVGKGFAVVADEIKKLANQSKESSNNITNLINNIAKGANKIISDGNDVGTKLKQSASGIEQISKVFKEIDLSVNVIGEKIKELNSLANNMDKEKSNVNNKMKESSEFAKNISASTEELLSSLHEINHGSKEIAINVSDLNNYISSLDSDIQEFKTKDNEDQINL